MSIPSNNCLYPLGVDKGLDLFDGHDPIDSDVIDEIELYDAGTKENQEPCVGDRETFDPTDEDVRYRFDSRATLESAVVAEFDLAAFNEDLELVCILFEGDNGGDVARPIGRRGEVRRAEVIRRIDDVLIAEQIPLFVVVAVDVHEREQRLRVFEAILIGLVDQWVPLVLVDIDWYPVVDAGFEELGAPDYRLGGELRGTVLAVNVIELFAVYLNVV